MSKPLKLFAIQQGNRESVIEVELDLNKDEELYKILNEVNINFDKWIFFFFRESDDSRQIMIYCSWMHRLVFSVVSMLFFSFVVQSLKFLFIAEFHKCC